MPPGSSGTRRLAWARSGSRLDPGKKLSQGTASSGYQTIVQCRLDEMHKLYYIARAAVGVSTWISASRISGLLLF